MPNQLRYELSPYLLEHADNPVDWRPWGGEAIGLARSLQRPIFLSIGYSACHWCHVMARESFEDAQIARLLNEHFVSIKVDREERPELDQIYMEAVQAMTGNGGWPLSVFLTPECEPFFGGTYWPPHARPGMAGFDQVLRAVADAWGSRREEVRGQAGRLTRLLQEQAARVAGPERAGAAAAPGSPTEHTPSGRTAQPAGMEVLAESLTEVSLQAEATLRGSFDADNGGFSTAPKFPQPLGLRWLLRRWRRTGDEGLLQMVVTTLDGMAAGGIFDHLGGGFHRYTVDARWLTPHFEKMLYDNAMLALAYVEAWQATGEARFAAVARETFDYLLTDLRDPRGGFYSAEDADSEGGEGAFYLWTPGEVDAVLDPETARAFCRVYDVTDAGNFEGRNILHLRGGLAAELAAARQALSAARRLRTRPRRDEKVLVCWNGLAIEALARCGAALGEPRYAAAAAAAAEFLWVNLRSADGRLLHCWRSGLAKHNAYLDDYAGLAGAVLAIHETGGRGERGGKDTETGSGTKYEVRSTECQFASDSGLPAPCSASAPSPPCSFPAPLDAAVALTDELLARFADAAHGGFFYTAADHEPLIVRRKDVIDAPVPSGNGLAVSVLLRLGRIAGRDDYREAGEQALFACLPIMRAAPTATFQLLLAAEEGIADGRADK
jgi:uncharacterized protein YyaL (SSP411 family)